MVDLFSLALQKSTITHSKHQKVSHQPQNILRPVPTPNITTSYVQAVAAAVVVPAFAALAAILSLISLLSQSLTEV